MNKAGLIAKVAEKLQCSRADAARAVDAVVGSILEGVDEDDKATLPRFGTFRKAHRKERLGRHPITKEPMTIPPSITITFSASGAVRRNGEP